jgi:hypothetical protein
MMDSMTVTGESAFEQLLSELSSAFVAVPDDPPDGSGYHVQSFASAPGVAGSPQAAGQCEAIARSVPGVGSVTPFTQTPRSRSRHRAAARTERALYSMGLVVATGCLHGSGIAAGLVHGRPWGQHLLRAAGAAVALAGVFLVWRAIA